MKKFKKILFLCGILFLFTCKVYALSLSKNNLTIASGGKDVVELYANVGDNKINMVEFTLVYSSNDVPAEFMINSSYTDSNPNGITHKVSFGEEKDGKILLGTVNIRVLSNASVNSGSVNIYNAKGYTATGEIVNLNNQSINVTVGTDEKKGTDTKTEEKEDDAEKIETIGAIEKNEIDENLLEKIESKIVSIDLKEGVFEYSVKIDDDVTELDLKAIAKSNDTKVEISNQKISELKDNKIVITATNGDIKQDYIINLKTRNEVEVTIDNGVFQSDDSYKNKWVVTCVPLGVLLIVGLFLTKKR